ncbi:hypothetical protein Lal_00012483 [Lupinus albus]|nr:hypothetical protein Lal_00012483 [Lupinus albus]
MSGRGRGRGSGQNDLLAQIAAVLTNMNENLQHLNQNATPSLSSQPLVPPGPTEYRGLDEFYRRKPSQFQGGFAPNAAIEWVQGLERIFRAMSCSDAQKVAYATYMLVKEPENWREMTRRQMEIEGQIITWEAFKSKFLQKYFPADLKREKEREFLQLEQGNMSVGEYSAKLEELIRYCPYVELELDGRSKCVKFEMGLRPELRVTFGHEEISDFPTLVNKCRMYENNVRRSDAVGRKDNPPKHYGPQRNFAHGKGKGKMFQEERKPYSPPTGSRGNISHGLKTHGNVEGSQLNSPFWCGKCGRTHVGDSCLGTMLTCFYCKEVGHTRIYCPKLTQSVNAVRAERPHSTGRVFTMSGAETSGVDGQIKGNCMVAGIPLLVLFYSGATHSFVSNDCVSTPTDVPVVVSTVLSRCPVVVNGRTFTVDLMCLPLTQLDLILGMDWLSTNHVMLNCADKTVVFGNLDEVSDEVSDMKPLSAKEYQSWKSRLSERFSPERSLGRVKSWAILEDSRLTESCLAWARNSILGLLTL